MGHFVGMIATWLLGAVAVVGLVAGADAAAETAGNGLGTIGITAGAMAGGADNLMKGFDAAKRAADRTGNQQRDSYNGGNNGVANRNNNRGAR